MNEQKKVTITTRYAVLIGIIVESPPKEYIPPYFGILDLSHGIWLKRKHKYSFLSKEDILDIKPTTIFDIEKE